MGLPLDARGRPASKQARVPAVAALPSVGTILPLAERLSSAAMGGFKGGLGGSWPNLRFGLKSFIFSIFIFDLIY